MLVADDVALDLVRGLRRARAARISVTIAKKKREGLVPRRASSGISKQMRLRHRAEFLAVQAGGAKLHGRHVLAIAKRRGQPRPEAFEDHGRSIDPAWICEQTLEQVDRHRSVAVRDPRDRVTATAPRVPACIALDHREGALV